MKFQKNKLRKNRNTVNLLLMLLLIVMLSGCRKRSSEKTSGSDLPEVRRDRITRDRYVIKPQKDEVVTVKSEPHEDPADRLREQYRQKIQEVMETESRVVSKKAVEELPVRVEVSQPKPVESTSSPDSKKVTNYVIKPGDNLWSISRNYGISLERILQLNNLTKNSKIFPGQVIKLDGSISSMPAVTQPKSVSSTPSQTASPVVSSKTGFVWPVSGTVISTFDHKNRGIRIETAPNAAVRVVEAGEVIYSGMIKDLGRTIVIDHQNGYFSVYGNNETSLVKQGDKVKKGQRICSVAKGTQGIHYLYFELRKTVPGKAEAEPVDPEKHILT